MAELPCYDPDDPGNGPAYHTGKHDRAYAACDRALEALRALAAGKE